MFLHHIFSFSSALSLNQRELGVHLAHWVSGFLALGSKSYICRDLWGSNLAPRVSEDDAVPTRPIMHGLLASQNVLKSLDQAYFFADFYATPTNCFTGFMIEF